MNYSNGRDSRVVTMPDNNSNRKSPEFPSASRFPYIRAIYRILYSYSNLKMKKKRKKTLFEETGTKRGRSRTIVQTMLSHVPFFIQGKGKTNSPFLGGFSKAHGGVAAFPRLGRKRKIRDHATDEEGGIFFFFYPSYLPPRRLIVRSISYRNGGRGWLKTRLSRDNSSYNAISLTVPLTIGFGAALLPACLSFSCSIERRVQLKFSRLTNVEPTNRQRS